MAGRKEIQRTSDLVSDDGRDASGAFELKAPFKRCALRAGIDKHLTPQAMRRTSKSLIRKTAGAIVARAITGHTTQQMTQHYSEVDHDERTAVLRAAFGGALGTQKSNPRA